MVLNRFFINVLARVALIVLTSVLLGIVLQHLDRGYYYTLSGMIFLIVLQTWLLVNQVNKTNTDWKNSFHRLKIMTLPSGFLKIQRTTHSENCMTE